MSYVIHAIQTEIKEQLPLATEVLVDATPILEGGFATLFPSAGEAMGDAGTYAAAVRSAMLNFNASNPGKDNYDPFYPGGCVDHQGGCIRAVLYFLID